MRLNKIWISLSVLSILILIGSFLFKSQLGEYYQGVVISALYFWAITWVALFVATRSLKSTTVRQSTNMLLMAVTIKLLFSMLFLLIIYAANKAEVKLFAYPFLIGYIVYLGFTSVWLVVISKKSTIKREEAEVA